VFNQADTWNLFGISVSLITGHGYHSDGLTCLSMTSDSQTVVSGSKDSSVHIVNVNSGQVGVAYSSSWSLFFFSPFLHFWSMLGVFSGRWLISRPHQFQWVCWYLVKVVSQSSWQMATQFCCRFWLSCLQLWLGSYREHGSKADHLGPHAPIQPMHLRT